MTLPFVSVLDKSDVLAKTGTQTLRKVKSSDVLCIIELYFGLIVDRIVT